VQHAKQLHIDKKIACSCEHQLSTTASAMPQLDCTLKLLTKLACTKTFIQKKTVTTCSNTGAPHTLLQPALVAAHNAPLQAVLQGSAAPSSSHQQHR
jgi:hypothetical protein